MSILLMGLLCFGLYHFIFKVWLNAYTHHNQEIEIPDLSELDVQHAIATLDKLKLTYEIDSIKYDSSKAPFSILEFYPQAGFKVKEGRKIFIKSNPSGWRPTNLPDIVGKSKRLAFTQLKMAGLSVGDTIYEPDIAKDAVLRVMYQGKPIAFNEVLPRFSKVDVVLGQGLEYGVKMENLVGMRLEDAQAAIIANQFEIGMLNVQGIVTDSSQLKVFYQYPIADDYYDQGLPVDLWVTQGLPVSEDDTPAQKERKIRQSRELSEIIKNLDRQFKNYGSNDSIAAAKYAEELGTKRSEMVIPTEADGQTATPEQVPATTDIPKGMEID